MATLLHLLSLQHQNMPMATPFNPDKQHTIGSSVTISGTGLHTGILADLTLHADNPGYGIQFKQNIDAGKNHYRNNGCKTHHQFYVYTQFYHPGLLENIWLGVSDIWRSF